MHDGHRLWLVAGDEGLLCLTASERDLEPYERLLGLVGREVEIFGVLVDGTRHAGGSGDGLPHPVVAIAFGLSCGMGDT